MFNSWLAPQKASLVQRTEVVVVIDGGGVGIVDFLALLANWGPCP